MNMVKHEIRQYLKSTLIWIAALGVIIIAFLGAYTGFSQDADAFLKLFEGLPPEVLDALSVDLMNLASLNGYFGYIMLYIVLSLSIMGMNLGLNLYAREYTDKTADFLLTKPVTRSKVVLSKLMAGLALILLINAAVTLSAYIVARVVEPDGFEAGIFLLISLTALFIQLIFFSLGVLIAVMSNRIRSVVTISISTVMAFFIASMVSNVIKEDKLRFFIPFQYFNFNEIIRSGGYDMLYVYLSLGIFAVFTAFSFFLFQRKDIHAV